jgi:hypothetical protein
MARLGTSHQICEGHKWQSRPGSPASCEEIGLQARYFFQQLLAGLEYCHTKVCCSAQKVAYRSCCMLLFWVVRSHGYRVRHMC